MSFGSAGLPVTVASAPARGASALAEKSTGTTAWLAAITGASTLTPAGRLADAHIQLAAEVGPAAVGSGSPAGSPWARATDITPVPSGICSALVDMRQLRRDRA